MHPGPGAPPQAYMEFEQLQKKKGVFPITVTNECLSEAAGPFSILVMAKHVSPRDDPPL